MNLLQNDYSTISSQALDYSAFRAGCVVMYSPYVTTNSIKFIRQMHPNSVYIKIILMVLIFSTACRIVTFNSSKSNSLFIFNIQNIFEQHNEIRNKFYFNHKLNRSDTILSVDSSCLSRTFSGFEVRL